jgi:hypothetical protein
MQSHNLCSESEKEVTFRAVNTRIMANFASIISDLTVFCMIFAIPVYILFLTLLWRNRKDEIMRMPFFRLMFSLGMFTENFLKKVH